MRLRQASQRSATAQEARTDVSSWDSATLHITYYLKCIMISTGTPVFREPQPTFVKISQQPRLARAFDVAVRELWQPPGLAAALCTASGFAWRFCHGERQIGSGVPIGETTAFALASATKTMAVATI